MKQKKKKLQHLKEIKHLKNKIEQSNYKDLILPKEN